MTAQQPIALCRKQHQAEYQLHDVTLKELAELGIHKLPSAEKLRRQQMGFSPASDDVRIAQYENDSHTPKPELIRKLADVLEIAPEYLSIPVPSTPEEIKVIEFWQEELSSSD